MCLGWLTADIRNHFEVLTLALLEQILLGNAASPMRKALIESGLGSALCDGCGFDAENRDTLFVFGLKDVAEDAMPDIEKLVLDVLRELHESGIDRRLIDSALHQVEFHRKEITNTPYPYGIKLLMSFAGPWFHGTDPLKLLNLDQDLEELRRKLDAGPLFEDAINRYFLSNPHRVALTLFPDRQLAAERLKREKEELDRIKNSLGDDELALLARDAERLRQLQEEVEDVSSLPTLQRDDIPPNVVTIRALDHDPQLPLLFYDQDTSGIGYLAAAAGAGGLPPGLIPLAPFFSFALARLGSRETGYVEMARRIDEFTGGVGLSTNARTRFDSQGDCVPFVSLNSKCLNRNLKPMFEIVEELMVSPDFSDTVRLKSILFEYRAALEAAVIHNGHRLAISLAARNYSAARALGEIWGGVSQLTRVKQLTDVISENTLEKLSADLEAIGKHLFSQSSIRMAFIGENTAIEAGEPSLQSLLRQLPEPEAGDGFNPPDVQTGADVIREGWITSTAVSFVAQALPTVRMEHPDSAALAVLARLLRSIVLHREIREKGGAYGGFALYNPEDGIFCLASYRDPHILRTLSVYREAADGLIRHGFDDEDVKEAILQVCSDIDKPDPPGPSARKAFYRRIVSLSDDLRSDFKKRVLNLRRSQVQAVVEAYLLNPDIQRSLAVISSEANLRAANEHIEEEPLTLKRI